MFGTGREPGFGQSSQQNQEGEQGGGIQRQDSSGGRRVLETVYEMLKL